MSNTNPTIRARAIPFCMAVHPNNPELTCTRINDHRGHCCDEIEGQSWGLRGVDANCRTRHDHSKEKGLVPA